MIRTLVQLLKMGNVTAKHMLPNLPDYSRGLPMVTSRPCKAADGCDACVSVCPTTAIEITGYRVALDRGVCIACGACALTCPTGTIDADRRTTVAVTDRKDLIHCNDQLPSGKRPASCAPSSFRRSLNVRVVSTGDGASDLEVAAATNPVFNVGRFGAAVVASPRFADALLVTGPVARAMREPLLRCYDAMAEPRLVIAAGASAISGGLHRGGYAAAEGVDRILPVAVYVPGHPPNPWYMIHGLLLAMGHRVLDSVGEAE